MTQTPPVRRSEPDGVYDLFIVALTLFSLLVVAAYFLLPLTGTTKQALLWLDLPISLIFVADSFACLRRAPSKGTYLKWGWLDFLGSIPLVLPLRIARLGRLVRAWRTLRLRRLSQVGEDLDQNRSLHQVLAGGNRIHKRKEHGSQDLFRGLGQELDGAGRGHPEPPITSSRTVPTSSGWNGF